MNPPQFIQQQQYGSSSPGFPPTNKPMAAFSKPLQQMGPMPTAYPPSNQGNTNLPPTGLNSIPAQPPSGSYTRAQSQQSLSANQLTQQMAELQVNQQLPPGLHQPPMGLQQPPPPSTLPPGNAVNGRSASPGTQQNYGFNGALPPQPQNQRPFLPQQMPPTSTMSTMLPSSNTPHQPPPVGFPPQIQQQQYVNGIQQPGPPRYIPGGMPPIPPQSQPPLNLKPPMNYNQPPMPGGHMPPYPGHYPPQNEYPQQQQRPRLDPDHMPSPIQVIMDDQNSRSGVFCTNQKGLVPPLVTTPFVVKDQGNASPRFIRSTMYNVPVTADMLKQANIPFGLVISPMARTVEDEYPPPIVDFGELGPVRCVRCKAYMCPYMQFIDSGRRFQCLFCKATTEVPVEYFQHLDHTGERADKYQRPELVLGTYEFVATKDYCQNNTFPRPPALIFVIDVSYNNVKSGLVRLLCAEMRQLIRQLPIDAGQQRSNMRVGFITYNKTVHFYNIKGSLAQPQMLVVGDVNEMFMPLLDGFLCDVEESEAVIDALMQQIPTMFGDTRETETVLLPAIQAGLEALKASECAGKLLVFHSSLPIAEAPGKLKNRDDRKVLGTDKERTVLAPQNNVYNNLGQECVVAGCGVDLFLMNNSYIDIATIGQVARLTGGEVYKYTYFQADTDGSRLIKDLMENISRPIAFNSIMRVRTSTGVRPTDFYGHFYMSNTTDMELACIDSSKAVAIEIKHDDKLTEEEGVYIQAALLYTSCSGQRRLRIINLSLNTCNQFADLYRSGDLDTVINFYSKQGVYRLLEHAPKAVKDGLIQRCAQTLACYRKHCAGPSTAGQLILPECMKLMPLFLNCLLKSDALSGGQDMTVDDRSYVMQMVMTMDVPTSVGFFYPRLIPVHDLDVNSDEIPLQIRCSIERMVDNGAYILENGIHMFLWIGLSVSTEWVQSLFGVPSIVQANMEIVELPVLDNPLSLRMRNLIEAIRMERPHCMRLCDDNRKFIDCFIGMPGRMYDARVFETLQYLKD